MLKKELTASLIKSDDLPDEVTKAAEGKDIDKWFYATVEVPDRENDIVRVKGIDTASFTQNGGPIKFISAHSRKPGPDGRLPVVGKAVEWVKTKHKGLGVPALAVGIKFAPTELGTEMKSLYDGEFLTDVSIGFQPKGKPQPIDGGGFDYTESSIGEISACVTGMNQYAAVMRAAIAEDASTGLIDALEPILAGLSDHAKALDQLNKSITSRLDAIESAIVATAHEAEQPGDHDDPHTLTVSDELKSAFDHISQLLSRK